MATEKDFETLLAKYPDLIEGGLRLLSRQVTVHGRRMDLVFEDRLGRQLIVELKWGPIKDEHIGQLMAYEGLLLSSADPTLRVMLIGTRVPPNMRRTLDHHGIAWMEFAVSKISSFLTERNDDELASIFSETGKPESARPPLRPKQMTKNVSQTPSHGTGAALFVPLEPRPLKDAFDYFGSGKDELYYFTKSPIGQARSLPIRHVYFKIKGESSVCAQARFTGLSRDRPIENCLPGKERTDGWYYGFRDLKRLVTNIELTSLKRFKTGNTLLNSVPGACIIQDPIDASDTKIRPDTQQ